MATDMKHPLPTCCDDVPRVDLSKISLPHITFSWTDLSFLLCAIYIVLCAIFWILVSYIEYKKRWLSALFCDSAYIGCTVVACIAILLSLLRNWAFRDVLATYPKWTLLQENWILWTGHTLVIVGLCLLCASLLRLGFYGTYFGVYFGIELPMKIYRFPYSVMDHPLYWGMFMLFFGASLSQACQAALILSILLGVSLWMAVVFESPIWEAIQARKKVTQGTQTEIMEELAKTSSTLPEIPSPKETKEKFKRKDATKPEVENIGKVKQDENKKDL